ncbi:hypothetical protein OM788_006586 [Streptomyces sp. KA12]|uniref:hypothetical protein n=1 Tax=Streptomyces sp. KA12 TaxID=2991730 RepID=UPI0023AE73D5|nr:hypothetical protein [Streptomyces sp. KA12]MDF0376588.1 hypothetical protein [Streptomyces sp. KA12]
MQQHDRGNSHDLAGYLVDLGRVEEAVTVLLHTSPPATARAEDTPVGRRAGILKP